MTRTNIKKLYLGVYTKDGEHIPVRLMSFIATPDNKWRGGIRKDRLLEKCKLEDISFYTLNGKAVRNKLIRKNPDSIGIIISDYEMRENRYDTTSFYEHDLKEVDDLWIDTRLDHFSELSKAKEELIKTEREMSSKIPSERLIEGYGYWSYCIEAGIIGDSEKYPGCHVLRRKYALVDIKDVHAIILGRIESYLLDIEEQLYDKGEL